MGGAGAVAPDRQGGLQVFEADLFGAVEQCVDQRQPDDVRLGACGRGADQAGLTGGQLGVELGIQIVVWPIETPEEAPWIADPRCPERISGAAGPCERSG